MKNIVFYQILIFSFWNYRIVLNLIIKVWNYCYRIEIRICLSAITELGLGPSLAIVNTKSHQCKAEIHQPLLSYSSFLPSIECIIICPCALVSFATTPVFFCSGLNYVTIWFWLPPASDHNIVCLTAASMALEIP